MSYDRDYHNRAVIGEEGYCIGPNPECGCDDCEESWDRVADLERD